MSKKQYEEIKGLFAFWRYDLYPYVCGAEVTRMDDKGLVYAPTYQGWVKPFKLLPLKKGKELYSALKEGEGGLENQRREALKKFNAEWDDTLSMLFPEALEKK